MIRKEDNDCYVIGIYVLVREHGRWFLPNDQRNSETPESFASLQDAHLFLTGEPLVEGAAP